MDEHERIYDQLSKPPRQPRIKPDVTATLLSSIPDLRDPTGLATQIEPATAGMQLWQSLTGALNSQTGRLLQAVASYLPFASEGFAAAKAPKTISTASEIFKAMMAGAGRGKDMEEVLKNAPSAVSLFQKPLLTKTGSLKWAPDPAEMLSSGKVQDVAGFDDWLANVEKASYTPQRPTGHTPPFVKDLIRLREEAYPVDWKHPQRSTVENPLIPATEPGGYTDINDAQEALRRMKRIEGKMNDALRETFMSEGKVDASGLRNVDVQNLFNLFTKGSKQ